jgi:peptidoglycan biosynthesis protein MviN/MurJ (putative lipid II flippase)
MTALTPLLIRADQQDPIGAATFRREAWTLTLGLAVLSSLAAAILLPELVRNGLLGAAPPVAAAAMAQAGRLAPSLGLGLAYGLLAAFLMARRSYANSLIDGAPALVIVIVLAFSRAGMADRLVEATLLGAAAQVALAIAAQRADVAALTPRPAFTSPLWTAALRNAGTVAIGVAAMGASVVADQLAAARLGPGANSALGYATRLTGLVVSLGALAVSRALLPALSDVADRRARRRLGFQWSGVLFAAGLAAAVAAWVAAPAGIRLFYQHGQFHAADTANVAQLFRLSVVQLPFYFATMALAQLLASSGDFAAFAAMGVLALGVKIAGLWALTPHWGLAGVILSTALMYVATFAGMSAWLRVKTAG